MLRQAIIALSLIGIAAAIIALVLGEWVPTIVAGWVIFQLAVLAAAILLERGRYRPTESTGQWIRTNERFQDPTTKRWTVVEYNPRTGERRYVEESRS